MPSPSETITLRVEVRASRVHTSAAFALETERLDTEGLETEGLETERLDTEVLPGTWTAELGHVGVTR